MNLLGMPTPLREADLVVQRTQPATYLHHVKIVHTPTGEVVDASGPTEVRAGAAALITLHTRLLKMGWKPE